MDINNQSAYWDSVAASKTFTHPIDVGLLSAHISKDAAIADYGCGYGRVVKTLGDAGFTNVQGFDTSAALIARGSKAGVGGLWHIVGPADLPLPADSVDCILLFAVLTCIPGNDGQRQLVELLRSKLKPGGLLYVSDYYLQPSSTEMSRYESLNGDPMNYGVFSLPEGATFRHHTREWIQELFAGFTVVHEALVPVHTMNGAEAQAFQMLLRK